MSADIGLTRSLPRPPSAPGESFQSAFECETDQQRPSRGRHAARFTPVDAATEPLATAGAVGSKGAHAMPPVGRFPTVSVVIPCRDNEKTIRATVESLLRQDYRALRQIILIGSPIDTTWEGLEGIYDRRLVIQEVLAPPGTHDANFKRDFGIRESSSEIVSLVDSGMVLPPDWLNRAVRALNGGEADGVAAVRRPMSDEFLGRFVDRRSLDVKTSGVSATGRRDGVRVNAFDPGEQAAIARGVPAAHAGQLPPARPDARPGMAHPLLRPISGTCPPWRQPITNRATDRRSRTTGELRRHSTILFAALAFRFSAAGRTIYRKPVPAPIEVMLERAVVSEAA